MLCQFLLYSRVNQLYVYLYPLFFGFPSHLGHHRSLSRVPCAIQQALISYLFYTQQSIYVSPNLPIRPTPPSPVGNHKFVLYICDSISALQISSSVPFYQIPHISDIMRLITIVSTCLSDQSICLIFRLYSIRLQVLQLYIIFPYMIFLYMPVKYR